MTQRPGAEEPPGRPACPEHGLDVCWFCCSERRPVCAQCPGQGGCRGHRVRPLAEEAAERRNQIVDHCERVQLQSASIARFVAEVLPEKKQHVVSTASKAREGLIRRLNFIRQVCDSEEQRLLEAAQTEEERAQQSILTQEVHWRESLQKLDALRSYLVAVITATNDCSLVQAEEEISLRTEEAEGILMPRESKELSFHSWCIHSPLARRLWASAVLCRASDNIHIDEKTIGPFLALSSNRRTLTFTPKMARRMDLDGPSHFDHWPNALAEESFCAGIHAWRVNFSHNSQHLNMKLLKCPAEIGVLIDLDEGELVFYDPESCAVLHMHQETFAAPIYPVLAVADQSISLV
ncbi:B box and SPRY domain-containing protein isoform X2 [Candoia aspera]|uniref:B box and SPRY domain-containing protein isoform X2 n=1 Tax=Candoia aspera TaxID=51853 RepID=UPI002FD862D0